jgi:hypothetical protein
METQNKMKLYSCLVRHSGNPDHSIPKQNVTAKEILLLKHMHGDDAVLNVAETGETERTDEHELFRLARTYKQKRVEKLLNVSLVGYAKWLERTIEAEDEARVAKETKRQATERIRRKQAGAEAAMAALAMLKTQPGATEVAI